MKKTAPLLIVLLVFLSLEARSQIVGFHITPGYYNSSVSKFNRIYDNGPSYGANILLGFNPIYLVGKIQRFSATGASRVNNIPEIGSADWDQRFRALGLRVYEMKAGKTLGYFAEVTWTNTRFEEHIQIESQGFDIYNQVYEDKASGLGLGLGFSINILIISIEPMAEYVWARIEPGSGIVKEENNVGGFFLSVGIGVKLP